MEEVKNDNLELFHDCIEESNNYLYEVFHKSYFELIEMTVDNILNGEIMTDVNPEQEAHLKEIYSRLDGVDFSVEDVRKSMQAIILRGFKEMRIPNGNTTPDTIGIFMTYLLTKMCHSKKINILDPLCGTGNLLMTISNHLDKECNLFACDNDPWMVKLTKMTADLLNLDVEIYLQDTFNLSLLGMDAIVCDMPYTPYEEGKEYFPYKALKHYSNLLNDDGAIIAMVGNDFFDYDKMHIFKNELFKTMSIIGLVELPDQMFKASKPKMILVLQKKKIEAKNCFMVKLPSFSDVKEFNRSLSEIEAWFEKNNYNKKSEEN